MDWPPIIELLSNNEREIIELFPTKKCQEKKDRGSVKLAKGNIEVLRLDRDDGYLMKNRHVVNMNGCSSCDHLFLPIHRKNINGKPFYLIEITNLLWSMMDYKERPEASRDYPTFVKEITDELVKKLYNSIELLCLLNKKLGNEPKDSLDWLCNIWSNIKSEEQFSIQSIAYDNCTFAVIIPNGKDVQIQETKSLETRAYRVIKSTINLKLKQLINKNKNRLISLIDGEALQSYEALERDIKQVSTSLKTAPH